jgi:hypothetical protein
MSSVVFPDIRSWGPVKKARMLFQNQYHRRIIRVIFFRKCHKERCPPMLKETIVIQEIHLERYINTVQVNVSHIFRALSIQV